MFVDSFLAYGKPCISVVVVELYMTHCHVFRTYHLCVLH